MLLPVARRGCTLSLCGMTNTEHNPQSMKTRSSADTLAWIAAVIAAVFFREVSSDLAIQLTPTLLACGITGACWIGLRALSYRISWAGENRWLSTPLAVASVFGAGVLALLVIHLLNIPAARGVVLMALALAGVGWGLSSEFIFTKRNARIA
jgi:hypothetical protein